jgi:hypothetical protein
MDEARPYVWMDADDADDHVRAYLRHQDDVVRQFRAQHRELYDLGYRIDTRSPNRLAVSNLPL